MREAVEHYVGTGKKFDLRVSYSIEHEPLGTGGALKKAGSLLGKDEEQLIATYGDLITNLNPLKLVRDLKADKNGKILGVIAAIPLRSSFGIIDLENGHASRFREKPILESYWMNAGVYVFSTKVLTSLPERGNFESETLPKLAAKRRILVSKFTRAAWRSMDSHKDVEEAQNEFKDFLPNIDG